MAVEFVWSSNTVPVISTIMGLFLVVFGLTSNVVKERLYLSEAVLTTLIGTLVGPFVFGFMDPFQWRDLNTVLLEFSRLAIAMQIMAAIVSLPMQYYRIHWKSMLTMLVPVMTASWLITSGLVYAILRVPFGLALIIGATLSPTDPILANSIVKGRFADRHVPRHVRHLLSAESACNDSTAALFMGIGVLVTKYSSDYAGKATAEFFIWIVAYEAILGALFGALLGWAARRALRYAEVHDLIDQENFLSFALALSILMDGAGMMLKLNDFVVVVVGAVAFSWDGCFYEQTKSSPFQEILDNLCNSWFFVFNGAIIPWPTIFGTAPLLLPTSPAFWQYLLLAVAVLALRRLPVTLMLYPALPSLTTIKEAAFVGHFGPMAGGAIYYMAFARAKLGGQYADAKVAPELEPAIQFVVVASILVHGCSVAFFKLGSTAVRTLSAGSSLSIGRRSRSRSRGRGQRERAPLAGVFTVSGPINARPLYTAAATGADDGIGAAGDTLVGRPAALKDLEEGAGSPASAPADGSVQLAVLNSGGNVVAIPIARETTIEIYDPRRDMRRASIVVAAAAPPSLRGTDSDETVGVPGAVDDKSGDLAGIDAETKE